jgi:dGTPase
VSNAAGRDHGYALRMANGLYERWLPKKPEPYRSEIEKDRDRVIHCSAFRRLQGKSQVFGAQMTDFFRNRLTHSLECAQIGRAIAGRARLSAWEECGESQDDFKTLVEVACLAHDLGHPPFGHNGEEALQEQMREHGGGHLFEGNAQSFRIVTYLEPKELGPLAGDRERWFGLNLTRASLQSISKYPWLETDRRVDQDRPKFSTYDYPADVEYFEWVWSGVEPKKSLAAEIMDAADDIAYATHDFEDGVWSGMVPLYDLVAGDDFAVHELHRKLLEKDETVTAEQVADSLSQLLKKAFEAGNFRDTELQWTRRPFERSRQNVMYLKRLSAAMIGMFIEAVIDNDRFKKPAGETKLMLNVLTGIAWVWMIERSDLRTRQFGQRRIVGRLFEGYVGEPQMLPRQRELRELKAEYGAAEDLRGHVVRLICDHIAGMTDQYALKAYDEMYRGQSPFEIRYAY